MVEILTLRAPAYGLLLVDVATPDAVYTNSVFPDGQRFASISAGSGVTVIVTGSVPGDLDDDGDVDLSDYGLFAAAMDGPAAPTPDPDADLDGDSDCDLSDLAIFMASFTGSL